MYGIRFGMCDAVLGTYHTYGIYQFLAIGLSPSARREPSINDDLRRHHISFAKSPPTRTPAVLLVPPSKQTSSGATTVVE